MVNIQGNGRKNNSVKEIEQHLIISATKDHASCPFPPPKNYGSFTNPLGEQKKKKKQKKKKTEHANTKQKRIHSVCHELEQERLILDEMAEKQIM